jgi:hypothetical protein
MDYLYSIVRLYRNATGLNVSLDDLVIGDIYYYPVENYSYFAPILVVYPNNTNHNITPIAVFQLNSSKPILIELDYTMGTGYTPTDPESPIVDDLNMILKYGVKPVKPQKVDYERLIALLIFITSLSAAIALMILPKRKKKT